MMQDRYAWVESDGRVSNVFLWDGETPYRPNEVELVACPDGVGIGWRNIGGEWQPPAEDEAA